MPPRKRTSPSKATGEPSEAELEGAVKVLESPEDELAKDSYVDDDELPIPDDLVFETPKKDRSEETEKPDDVIEFKIDDQLCVAVRPDPGAWVLLIRSLASSNTWVDRIDAIMAIVDNTFDDASKYYVRTRLMARGDDFDSELLMRIVQKLVETWTPRDGNRAQRRQIARANAAGR